MLRPLVAALVCALSVFTLSAFAQENAAPPSPGLHAAIPVFGESGERKLASGDARGAIADFREALEGSRTLSQQYPQEPAYRENAYYYLGRLASAFASVNDIPAALQMSETSARGYAALVTADPSPENKTKAADALGRLAWLQVLSGDGAAAEASARQALALAPEAVSVKVNLAHALLLNGKSEEARELYVAAAPQTTTDGRSVRVIILEDFDTMQQAGIATESIAPMRTAVGGGTAGVTRRRQQGSLPVWPFFALVALGFVAIFGSLIYFDRKRTAKLEAQANALGLTFRRKATLDDKQLAVGSPLTSVGRSRHIRNVIEVPGTDDTRMTLFELSYVIGNGKRSRNYRQTVTRIQSSALNLPIFDLRPESVLFRIAASLGMKDIDIEGWPGFSRMYLLRATDEAAIRRVFTPELLRYCEANRGLWMSGAGDLLWFHRENRRVKPEELATFVDAARQTFALFVSARASGKPIGTRG